MRAGLATLKKIERENVYSVLEKRTEKFCNEINKIAEQIKAPLQAIHYGSIFWLHKKTESTIRTIIDIPADHKTQFAKLFHALLNQGIYTAPSGLKLVFYL